MLATRNYLVAYIGNRLVACQAEKTPAIWTACSPGQRMVERLNIDGDGQEI
jgi:hypothetical protein